MDREKDYGLSTCTWIHTQTAWRTTEPTTGCGPNDGPWIGPSSRTSRPQPQSEEPRWPSRSVVLHKVCEVDCGWGYQEPSQKEEESRPAPQEQAEGFLQVLASKSKDFSVDFVTSAVTRDADALGDPPFGRFHRLLALAFSIFAL
uniref:Uncharacterized protein n=1 Tax=Solanum tuberosum TaxID=4113 RepID=M1DDZ1_SOLTU